MSVRCTVLVHGCKHAPIRWILDFTFPAPLLRILKNLQKLFNRGWLGLLEGQHVCQLLAVHF